MSRGLVLATMVMGASGVMLALICVFINTFSRLPDLADRNVSIVRMIKISVLCTLLFALISCLVADAGMIYETIESVAYTYMLISISWLVIMLVGGIALVGILISRSRFERNRAKALSKIMTIAFWTMLLAMVFAYLLE